jgi:hypothetical protein
MECAKDEKCIQIFQLPPCREFFMSATRRGQRRKSERGRAHTVGERDECVAPLKQIHAIKIVAATKSSAGDTQNQYQLGTRKN